MTRRALLAWAWTASILVACWLPESRMPFETKGSIEDEFPHIDKVVHGSMFVLFGLLWMRVGSSGGRRAARVLMGGALLAVVSELGQGLPIVGRDPGVLDALADLVGVAVGVAASAWMARRWPRSPTDSDPAGGVASGPR